jgi:hypothetical protein
MRGHDSLHVEWNNATWLFTSQAHREMFRKEPQRYAPEYGGYCAYGMKWNGFYSTDPKSFALVESRLYLNLDPKIHRRWQLLQGWNIRRADNNWQDKVEEFNQHQ